MKGLMAVALIASAGVLRADSFQIWQDHADALYRCGEEATFRVTVLDDAGQRRDQGSVRWSLDNFGEVRLGGGTVDLAKENPFVVRGRLEQPDFLRLTVDKDGLYRTWSVGYDVERIRQDSQVPADFDAYWQGEKARLDREVPIDARCELVKHNDGYDTYRVSFATFNQRRVYGFMTIPVNAALYPARVRIRVCDAGHGCVGPWEGNDGEITATLAVHAFEPAKDTATQVARLAEQNRMLGERWHLPTNRYNTAVGGIAGERGDYFFHDAMLGIARGIDWIIARPEADRTRVTYFGSSQGGGFGLYMVYLNGHFTRACFAVPAMTGHFGSRSKRANGWPNLIASVPEGERAKAAANAPYYDGVSFASRINIPCRFIVGFSDTTCPPPDVYAAYNACPSKDKAILNGIGCTHCYKDGWIEWLRDRRHLNPNFDYNGWLRAPNPGKTRVQLWFDTEDYIDPSAWDAARELATIMTEEGVRGHFNVVGQLARTLVEKRRFDVIDALRKHVIGTQSLYHSWHPNITEKSDLADYWEAYRLTLRDESMGDGYLRAAFGLDRLLFSCYPGNGSSYVAFDVHSDLGANFHGGAGAVFGRCPRGDAMWYQNLRHILYNGPMSLQDLGLTGDLSDAEIGQRLDEAAKCEAVVFYMHPCLATCTEFWDGVNLKHGNLTEFGHWIPAKRRDPEATKRFYVRFREFIRRVNTDARFEFTDCERLIAAQKPRVAITRADIPAIRTALLKELGPVDAPASWSVADCFLAAVGMLRGETRHVPGKVYGFLERPAGVTAPVKVKASDLRAAARNFAATRHLPVSYQVGDATLGPADFLYAALEVLATGAEEVTVTPRDQLGALAKHIPSMEKFRHTDGWIYTPEFKDRYLADRLRWQFWTLRYE